MGKESWGRTVCLVNFSYALCDMREKTLQTADDENREIWKERG